MKLEFIYSIVLFFKSNDKDVNKIVANSESISEIKRICVVSMNF